jgi:hypothetical protein
MKPFFALSLITALGLLGLSASAQIQIEPYAVQVNLNMNDLATYKAPIAKSDCGEVKVSFSDLRFSGGCAGTIERNYVFTDNCGSVSKAQIYFSLKDTDAPVITPPAEVKQPVDKKAIPPAAALVVTDNSGIDVDIVFDEKITGDFVERTWVCTDACGNQSQISQRIKLR